jgi:hypothetical protein
MGFFDDLFGGTGKRLARENRADLQAREKESQGYLDTSYQKGQNFLLDAVQGYKPLSDFSGQLMGSGKLYADSMGVNGAAGNQAAMQAFNAGPGYQFARDQALEGVLRKANAAGGLGGNALVALQERGTQLANQSYGDWQNRLGQLASLAASSGAAAGSGMAGAYGALGNQATQYGRDKVGVVQNTGEGVSRTYQNEAAAAQSGAANLAGLGMNLLGLGANVFGGGGGLGGLGSLFGGGGGKSGGGFVSPYSFY